MPSCIRLLKALFKDILMCHELEKCPLWLSLIKIALLVNGNDETKKMLQIKVWWTYFVLSTYNVVVSQPSPVAGCIYVMEAAIQSEQ